MALAQKRIGIVDAATLALWRVAETGDIDELAALLPRVTNINARNQHGVTALMRAAQNGHVTVVRLLLEHGADANIKRNDKFTALALAAFFGHTEVVRALLEHGADSQASTRSGTSPRMWATARTFDEVVGELEKPVMQARAVAQAKPPHQTKPLRFAKKEAVPEASTSRAVPTPAVNSPMPRAVPAPSTSFPAQAVPTLAASPTAPGAAPASSGVRPASTVVRTLKEPPEIWDLVHEVPRGFNARSAFLTRLQSMKSGLAFSAAALVFLIGIGVVGVMLLRGVQARNERTVKPQPTISSQPKKISPPPAPAQIAPAPVIAAPTVSDTDTQTAVVPDAVAPRANHNNKPIAISKPAARLRVATSNPVEPRATRVEPNQVEPPIAASPEKPAPPARAENTTKNKTTTPLSPQLISPGKSSAPKAKVIQWP